MSSSTTAPPPAIPPAQTCPAYNRTILRTEAVVFWNTRPILRSHNLFRFGHSSNITAAIVPPTTLVPTNASTSTSSSEYTTTTSLAERRDYIVGLFSIPLLMFFVFGAWLLILGVFRCRPRTFGFLAGRRIVLPDKPVSVHSSSDAGPAIDGDPADDAVGKEPNDADADVGMNNGNDYSYDEEGRSRESESDTPVHPDSQNAQPLPVPTDSLEATTGPDDDNDDDDDLPNLDEPATSIVVPSQRSVPSRIPDPEAERGPNGSMHVPESLASERQQIEDWKELVRKREMRMARIRIAVLVSGLTIVVMAVLMIVYGVQNLSASVSDSLQGIDSALDLCDAALALLDSYVSFRTETMSVTKSAVNTTNYTLCPQVEEVLCGGSTCTDVLTQIVDVLSQSNLVFDSITSVRSDVENIQGMLTYVKSTIVSFNWAFWIAAGAVVLLAVCTLILMNSVVLAWRHRQLSGGCWYRWTSRFRGWVVVPIFTLLLLIGFVFSMVFVVGSMASADFCFNSPDANVLAFLNSIQGDFSSVLYPLIVFYVSGCEQIDVVQTNVVPLAALTVQVLTEANAVLANVTAAVPEISSVCGTDPTSLRVLLAEVSRLLCVTADTVLDTIDFFTCSNWNGLYSSVMYNAVCYNGNTGFGWIAATQIVILICSLIFLTLRVAFYELVDESEINKSRPSCTSCLRFRKSRCFCLASRVVRCRKKSNGHDSNCK